MLPVHALVSLAEAKAALRIRSTDTQLDSLIEGIILEATDFVESTTGRRIVWRAQPGSPVIAAGAVADGMMSVTTPSRYPFYISYEWTAGPDNVKCDVIVTGVRATLPVVETVHIPDGGRETFNGNALFDSVTSVEIDNTSGDGTAALCIVAAQPYVERHHAEGQQHLYVVHRPIMSVVLVEDGDVDAGSTGWMTLPESMYFVNTSLGKISRVSKTRGFVDFPEDFAFRYPQRAEQGFGPWAPDARLTYFGGYLSSAAANPTLRSNTLLAITGLYRERERKEADLESQTNSVGSTSRANWREAVVKALRDDRRMTASGEGMPS